MGFTIYWKTDPNRLPITDLELDNALRAIDAFCERHADVLENAREDRSRLVNVRRDWPVETLLFGCLSEEEVRSILNVTDPTFPHESELGQLAPYIYQGRIKFGFCKTNRHPESTRLIRMLLVEINEAIHHKLQINDDDKTDYSQPEPWNNPV